VLLVAGLSLPIRPAKRAASLSLAGGGGARASSPSRGRFGLGKRHPVDRKALLAIVPPLSARRSLMAERSGLPSTAPAGAARVCERSSPQVFGPAPTHVRSDQNRWQTVSCCHR